MLADLEPHLHIELLPEPSSIGVPLLVLRDPLQIESLQDKRNKLANLHNGDVLANARAGAMAELNVPNYPSFTKHPAIRR
jgi:hypothetical protein